MPCYACYVTPCVPFHLFPTLRLLCFAWISLPFTVTSIALTIILRLQSYAMLRLRSYIMLLTTLSVHLILRVALLIIVAQLTAVNTFWIALHRSPNSNVFCVLEYCIWCGEQVTRIVAKQLPPSTSAIHPPRQFHQSSKPAVHGIIQYLVAPTSVSNLPITFIQSESY